MTSYLVTLDDLVAFAQEGWQYPLADDEDTRAQIGAWLADRGVAPVKAKRCPYDGSLCDSELCGDYCAAMES